MCPGGGESLEQKWSYQGLGCDGEGVVQPCSGTEFFAFNGIRAGLEMLAGQGGERRLQKKLPQVWPPSFRWAKWCGQGLV